MGAPMGDTCHLLGFMVQGQHNRDRCTNIPLDATHRSIGAPNSVIPTIFEPDTLPAATLSIYPALGQAQSAWLHTRWLDLHIYNKLHDPYLGDETLSNLSQIVLSCVHSYSVDTQWLQF